MTKVISDQDIKNDRLEDKPFIRVNRSNSLQLSNSWQRLVFDGTSTLNANTFPDSSVVQGVKVVDWDAVNNKFTFNRDTVGFYLVQLGIEFTGGMRPAEIQLRFVIDSEPVVTFPFPDTSGYIVIDDIGRLSDSSVEYNRPIRSTSILTDNGLGIELRSPDSLLTHPSVSHAILEIYPI